jgi:hypothetical protein
MLPKATSRAERIHALTHYLAELDLARAWSVEVKEHKRRNTTQQKRYLFGVVYAEIAKHLEGWDIDDISEYFLGEEYGWHEGDLMGRKTSKPLRRLSSLSTTECSDHIAFIQRKAAGMGIYIPEPDEEFDEPQG